MRALVWEAAAWWLVLLVAYLVLISPVTVHEVALGAVIAAAAAVVAAAATRGFRPAGPPRELRWSQLVSLPLDVGRDAVTLVAGLSPHRARAGSIDRVRLPEGNGPAVRAYAVLALSISPGNYVIDVHPGENEPGEVRVHRLGASGRLERIVESRR